MCGSTRVRRVEETRDEGMDLLAVVPFWEQPINTHSPEYVSATLMAVIEGHNPQSCTHDCLTMCKSLL